VYRARLTRPKLDERAVRAILILLFLDGASEGDRVRRWIARYRQSVRRGYVRPKLMNWEIIELREMAERRWNELEKVERKALWKIMRLADRIKRGETRGAYRWRK
jgi:DNA-binding transcriptional regulator YbjK